MQEKQSLRNILFMVCPTLVRLQFKKKGDLNKLTINLKRKLHTFSQFFYFRNKTFERKKLNYN